MKKLTAKLREFLERERKISEEIKNAQSLPAAKLTIIKADLVEFRKNFFDNFFNEFSKDVEGGSKILIQEMRRQFLRKDVNLPLKEKEELWERLKRYESSNSLKFSEITAQKLSGSSKIKMGWNSKSGRES